MVENLPEPRFDPIFPVTDMDRAVTHYKALSFTVTTFDGHYSFAIWPGTGSIHLSLVDAAKYDGKTMAGSAYMYVEDSRALAQKWKQALPDADTRDVVETQYGLDEGAHLDPDNNLIRFGSRSKK